MRAGGGVVSTGVVAGGAPAAPTVAALITVAVRPLDFVTVMTGAKLPAVA